MAEGSNRNRMDPEPSDQNIISSWKSSICVLFRVRIVPGKEFIKLAVVLNIIYHTLPYNQP